jgi:hypothetical protein
MAITKERIIQEAQELGCEPACIVAVDKVESGGNGFLEDGKTPKILFEPHVFWKELKKRKIDPTKFVEGNEDILYPVWGTHPYGPTVEQHARLERAVKINKEAALSSASWGRYQIMGFNYKMCGCSKLQDFLNKIYKSEDDHLDLFVYYIKSAQLDDELREKDWAGFARGYNGSLFARNKYDEKLNEAYNKAKLQGY